jgi:murein L,D-transpeptidase YafK
MTLYRLLTLRLMLLLAFMTTHDSWAMGQNSVAQEPLPKIHKVEVHKSARRMELLTKTDNGYEVVKSYAINLGGNPVGHKQQEGDQRTPEGRYTLNWKNPKSAYHLSIHLSYPNAQDRARAQARGVSPGGEIFIHGMPNSTRNWAWLVSPTLYLIDRELPNEMIHQAMSLFDWTNGCIAVQNKEMEEIYQLVDMPTPIEIFP